jgi:hypothetical protein
MSRRMHFGHNHQPYFIAYLFCLGQIETRYDWDSVRHYRFTGDIRKVTCRKCLSEFYTMDEESQKLSRGF